MDFASKMRLLRAARGLTQRELGTRAGIPTYTIPWIESGRMLPSAEFEQRIRRALAWPENAEDAFAILAAPPIAT